MRRTGATLILLILAMALWQSAADARHRGETCWRTNHYTHQHFRIC